MTNPRLWIAILASVCFLAGMASGLLVAERSRPALESEQPFADYRREFVARFELDARRERLFAELLRTYARDLEDIRQRALASSVSAMDEQLAATGLRYRDYIRNHVLPESQRAAFDAQARDWTLVP